MAIVIPSKNIYSKNFDPVVDNNIDRVEVQANKVQQTEDYSDLVYSEQIPIQSTITASANSDIKSASTFATGDSYWGFACFVKCEDTKYIEKEFYIPKNSNNKTIKAINTGIDSNGNTKIEYTLWGTYTTGTATGQFPYSFNSSGILSVSEGTITKNAGTTNEGSFNVPSNLENEKQNADFLVSFESGTTILAKALIPIDNGTVGSAKTELVTIDGIEQYKIILKILCNVTTYIMQSGSYGILGKKNTNGNSNMTGTYTVYNAERIDISFYGHTIGIDLQDKTETIGNGNNVFSFDGNELIQTTNTPSIETKYQDVVNEWKNGKQTAVITCPIADYYDENGNQKISSESTEIVKGYVKVKCIGAEKGTLFKTVPMQEVDTRLLKNDDTVTVREGLNTHILIVSNYNFENGKFEAIVIGQNWLVVDIVYTTQTPIMENVSMVFHKGDIVIPYTYTNQGDKPLSYNKDFTPKKFKVVGTKISKKQGGTQELTLQEV